MAVNIIAVGMTAVLGIAWFAQGGQTPPVTSAVRLQAVMPEAAGWFKGIPVLGVEPAANVAKVAWEEKQIPSVVKFFGVETAKELVATGREFLAVRDCYNRGLPRHHEPPPAPCGMNEAPAWLPMPASFNNTLIHVI